MGRRSEREGRSKRAGAMGRRGQACTAALLWDHEAERAGRAGRAGRAEGAGMHWGPLKSAYQERGVGPGSMEPWDHGAVSHGGRNGREGEGTAEGAGMRWGPLKSAYRRKAWGQKDGAMGPWGHELWGKGPLKSATKPAHRREGHGVRGLEPWDHGAMGALLWDHGAMGP